MGVLTLHDLGLSGDLFSYMTAVGPAAFAAGGVHAPKSSWSPPVPMPPSGDPYLPANRVHTGYSGQESWESDDEFFARMRASQAREQARKGSGGRTIVYPAPPGGKLPGVTYDPSTGKAYSVPGGSIPAVPIRPLADPMYYAPRQPSVVMLPPMPGPATALWQAYLMPHVTRGPIYGAGGGGGYSVSV